LIKLWKGPETVGPAMESSALVGIVCDRRTADGVDVEMVRARYPDAMRRTAGVTPVIIPTGLDTDELTACLKVLNGLLLTGSDSNVSPTHYEGASLPEMVLDTHRDQTSLTAIGIALALDVPLLGICRGLQELNVALGGTLSPDISNAQGRLTHAEDLALPRDIQYAPTHEIEIEGDGYIAGCIRRSPGNPTRVNSLHTQGIDQLASGLAVDARCSDGVIEAVSVSKARTFAAAVQWHPEWFHDQDLLSREIFRSFGEACRDHKRLSGTASLTDLLCKDWNCCGNRHKN
jgi:putative glutamine amidotransferase